MIRVAAAGVIMLFVASVAEAQGPQLTPRAYAGLYRSAGDRHVIVRPTGSTELQLTDMKTGEVRLLSPQGDASFTHGPTRRLPSPTAGRVRFDVEGGRVTGLVWQSERFGDLRATREPLRVRDVTVENGDLSRIQGELILPTTGACGPVAVMVPLGDRYSLWEPAMWLVKAGIGVFVYDQRHAGGSTGQPLDTPSHTLETQLLADDAAAVTREVRQLPCVEPAKVGIMGWSQGGWIGAMVLFRVPDLAFYVNVAANANPWPEQGRHRFWARLQREGFGEQALNEAGAYFDAYHDALAMRIGWDEYWRVRTRYLETKWFQFLLGTFPFFQATRYAHLMAHYLSERDPAVYFERISRTPTLGVYFEFDQSNPPDSPERFRRALLDAGNRRVTVRVMPGLDHGAWVVPGYAVDSSAITRRGTAPFEAIGQWILEVIE